MKLTTKYLLMICSVVFAVNLVMGFVIAHQSKNAMLTMINQRMLNVANIAAASLDGDVLETITADDKADNTENYREIMESLTLYLENADVTYIYTIQDMGNDKFGFIIDSDPVDPGEFGGEIVTTDALIAAAAGTPSVDQEAFTDSWGRFYSAYSPVLDSNGKVAGIVGADFDAQWLEDQIRRQYLSILIIGMAAVLIGAVLVLIVATRATGRFQEMYEELSSLTDDVAELNKEIVNNPDYKGLVEDAGVEVTIEDTESVKGADVTEDAIGALSAKLKSMHDNMNSYLSIVRRQAYADPMTGVGNRTAYSNAVKRLNMSISQGIASYSVIIVDIDNLKSINDDHGHEYGDKVVYDVAGILKKAYGAEHLYRINDDSFMIITDSMTLKHIGEINRSVDEDIADYNNQLGDVKVQISKGAAVYRPGLDAEYRETFKRADEELAATRQGLA